MGRILQLPLLVVLTGAGALAMLLPAAHAVVFADFTVARPFFYGSVMFCLLAAVVGIATSNYRPRSVARSQLAALLGAYLWLPFLFAVPFNEAVPDTSFANSWFEMVSSFTTTGATQYDTPGRLAPSLHLWRALVGWMGGFFVLLSAVAVLAPLNLGGVEVLSGRVPGRGAQGAEQITHGANPSERLIRHASALFPVYFGLTLLLWVMLLIAGERGLTALCLAMSTLSTSGITNGQGVANATSGFVTEVMIFVFMALALTRRSFPGAVLTDRNRSLRDDHEVQLATFFLVVVPTLLFFRHWLGALAADDVLNAKAAFDALWGGLFTTMSFLTTTGFESADWQDARSWSGLNSPGLILLGLAMMGGGIATTAGGLKLLRVYALARHGEREMDRLVHPSSIGGGGDGERRLRKSGAYVAWIFFMLYAITFAIVIAALSLRGLEFEQSLVLTVAAVTTTGPLAAMASDVPIRMLELTVSEKAILGAAMIVGRVEILAILALFAPGVWRR
ncbi:TrkH family potassium uptake protein [Pseudorhodobacter sp. E13]|uniref:TrkH family potassium uptake protein n=1 Tax=Pseudorhodobacter sp. E13 TaxID=2487931 RepID=UPI000F8F4CB2|nr:potassium transporter TrkG [Pseudorhodobacter sp. E13]RUS60388.1 TrkH family potassium uptake protein [Pseudorhodobacter sp. E13]